MAISGSLRQTSTSTAVLQAAARLAPEGVEVASYAGLGSLPLFNPDLDGVLTPVPVIDLRREIGRADALLICSPEYARGIAGALKNGLDWLVSSEEFQGSRSPSSTPLSGPSTPTPASGSCCGRCRRLWSRRLQSPCRCWAVSSMPMALQPTRHFRRGCARPSRPWWTRQAVRTSADRHRPIAPMRQTGPLSRWRRAACSSGSRPSS